MNGVPRPENHYPVAARFQPFRKGQKVGMMHRRTAAHITGHREDCPSGPLSLQRSDIDPPVLVSPPLPWFFQKSFLEFLLGICAVR